MANPSKRKPATTVTGAERQKSRTASHWRFIAGWPKRYWQRNWFHKVISVVAIFIFVTVGSAYGIARWYMWQQSSQPWTIGTSFIPDYARSLGVEPEATLVALLNDLGIRQLRLVGYWNKIEAQRGTYDFSELDWQFEKANRAGAKVSLSLGLRQPRWPECHMPKWAEDMPMSQWSPELNKFITAVVERYRDNPALDSYQLENEFFLTVFGDCPDFSRERLVQEYDLVKRTDPKHQLIVTRSNNAWGFPLGKPQADLYGVSVYKRVWDITITKRYVEYPFPAWFYGFLGGGGKLFTGKDLFLHELQAEPWPPNGQSIADTPLAEQSKSLDAKRMRDRIEYGKATGLRTMYLWGSEYWYYRKQVLKDPSVWNVAKDEIEKARQENIRDGHQPAGN